MSGIITNAEEAKEYALSCDPFILVDEKTGEAITYSAGTPSGQSSPHFIRELDASTGDTYIGTIFDFEKFRTTAKSPLGSHPALMLFERFWQQTKAPMEMDGVHLEPFAEQKGKGVAPAQRGKKPDAAPTSDHDMGKAAYRIHKDIDDLKAGLNAVKSDLRILQTALEAFKMGNKWTKQLVDFVADSKISAVRMTAYVSMIQFAVVLSLRISPASDMWWLPVPIGIVSIVLVVVAGKQERNAGVLEAEQKKYFDAVPQIHEILERLDRIERKISNAR